MDKYIYDKKTSYGMNFRTIIIFPVLPYLPKKNSLSVCGDSDTCGI